MANTRRISKLLAVGVALGLVGAACGGDDGESGGTTAAPSETTAPTGTTGPGGTTAPEGDDNAWALAYTGGTAGKASGEPVIIGYINQEGGVPAFPEATVGIEAAVKYVNEELGGVGGRPIQLKKCLVKAEEDGQKCAQEMVNDDKVALVMTGTLVIGNASMYETLNGRKPVLIGNGVTNADFTTTAGYSFTAGSPGVIPALAIFAVTRLDPKPTTAAVVHSDNDAGRVAAELLLKPIFEAAGVKTTLVPLADTAGGPEAATALQAAGADKADVVVPLVTIQGCIAAADALESLAIKPRVVTTGLCFGTPMTKHLGGDPAKGDFLVPDGWYFGGYGYSYFIPDEESGMNTYLRKIRQYGGDDVEYTGFAGPMFANLLTVTKFMNELGPDNITPAAIEDKIKNFKGPMMIQAGEIKCGYHPIFKSVCADTAGIQQFKDGKWISAADGLNGDPIVVPVPG